MSPLKIQMLLHFYTTPTPWTEWHPAQLEAWESFVNEGLVESDRETFAAALTERGQAYVRFLMEVPLPVCVWRLPSPRQEVTA